jgi:hypothetical protein
MTFVESRTRFFDKRGENMSYLPIRGYQLRLPIAIRTSEHRKAEGFTDYISASRICFSLPEPLTARRGQRIAFLVRLPEKMTGGNQMLVRARGKVVAVERISGPGIQDLTSVTATMDGYDFVAKDRNDKAFS